MDHENLLKESDQIDRQFNEILKDIDDEKF
jgi:hypothetical protein